MLDTFIWLFIQFVTRELPETNVLFVWLVDTWKSEIVRNNAVGLWDVI